MQEIAELYEQEQNFEQAIVYYEKAADLFQSEEVTTSANQCNQKIAQYAAQLEQLSLSALSKWLCHIKGYLRIYTRIIFCITFSSCSYAPSSSVWPLNL